jgi:histone H3/H4
MSDSMVVQSKVREFVKKNNLRLSSDAIDALNKSVEELLKKAAERCKQNNRQTIRPADF